MQGGGGQSDNRSRRDVARVVQSHSDSREADREREPEEDGAGPATDEEHGERDGERGRGVVAREGRVGGAAGYKGHVSRVSRERTVAEPDRPERHVGEEPDAGRADAREAGKPPANGAARAVAEPEQRGQQDVERDAHDAKPFDDVLEAVVPTERGVEVVDERPVDSRSVVVW